MFWWNRLVAGLRALGSKRCKRAELDEELRAYMDAAAGEKMRGGNGSEQAHRRIAAMAAHRARIGPR